MKKVLEMVFRNEMGKEVIVSLPEPKEELKLAQVKPLMESVVAKRLLTSKGGALTQVVEARIRSKEQVVLA